MMYRYFEDLMSCSNKGICDRIEQLSRLMNKISDNWKRDVDFLDQRLKDGIQNNAMCCKLAIEKLNNKIDALQPKKDKYEPKKPAAKKPPATN